MSDIEGRSNEKIVSPSLIDDPTMIPTPLDRFPIPLKLDGRNGANRCDGSPQIPAQTDVEAVFYFLDKHVKMKNTRRTYLRTIQRFVLWSIIAEKKPISSLDYEAFYRYQSFLENPTPREQWVAPRYTKKNTDQWRPFEGRLSSSVQQLEFTILNILFAYLVDVRYVSANPVPRSLTHELNRTSRAPGFRDEAWVALRESIEAMPQKTRLDVIRYARARWLIALFSTTPLRLSQVVRTQMNGFFSQAQSCLRRSVVAGY